MEYNYAFYSPGRNKSLVTTGHGLIRRRSNLLLFNLELGMEHETS